MPTRLRFIDATRALFLIQGVIYHSLLPFHEAKRWVVSNPEAVSGISALTDWMHSFRMHGFFLISGLVSWRLLQQGNISAFLLARLRRVLIPLVVVLLTVSVIERSLIVKHHSDWGWGDSTVAPLYLGALWFLVCLMMFTFSLPIARAVVASSRMIRLVELWSPAQVERSLPLLFAAGSIVVVLLARTAPDWWYAPQFGIIDPAGLLMYGGYFMAGALLARTGHASLLATKPGILWWVAATAGWVVIQAISTASFQGAWALSSVLRNVYAIVALRLIFWGVEQIVQAGYSRWDALLVNASYTVYLLHQVVVVAVASLLAWMPWPPLIKIVIIIASAFLLPFVFHHFVVQRSSRLSFLLNGTTLSRNRVAVKPLAWRVGRRAGWD